jgi:hypothetical protein
MFAFENWTSPDRSAAVLWSGSRTIRNLASIPWRSKKPSSFA